jgi:LacI family transcriptional regulator
MRCSALVPEGLGADGIDHGLIRQIRERPAPLGIYAFIDAQAVWLRDQILMAGLDIPGEVALIGTGNHRRQCESRERDLSSVAFPWSQFGLCVGRQLERLIRGHRQGRVPLVQPTQVIERASTGAVLAKDPLVRQATDWLRQHLDCARPLAEVAQACAVSTATISRRFRADLDASPKSILDRFRLERVRQLLATSSLSVNEIAQLTGYSSATALGVAFRRRHGCTPLAWRGEGV